MCVCVRERGRERERERERYFHSLTTQAPPTTLKELEEYIRDIVRKELSRDSIEFGPELGSGEFGAVFRGEHTAADIETGATAKQTVAIKMLKNCAFGMSCVCVCLTLSHFSISSSLSILTRSSATSDDDKVRFLKEAAIMAQFNHPNIVSLVGVCTLPTTAPTLIVLEYMHLGALHGYLQSPMVKDRLETLTMLRMALDIGSAMQYLAEAGFVVRIYIYIYVCVCVCVYVCMYVCMYVFESERESRGVRYMCAFLYLSTR